VLEVEGRKGKGRGSKKWNECVDAHMTRLGLIREDIVIYLFDNDIPHQQALN